MTREPDHTPSRDQKARARADKAYAKATRPWWRKKRAWAAGLIAALAVAGIATSTSGPAGTDDGASPTATAPADPAPTGTPVVVTADRLLQDLETNPLNAANTYDGQRVDLTGTLDVVDASGGYISLRGANEYTLIGVQVRIDEAHRDTVARLTKGDQVHVTGTVTGVGEVMGYSVDADTVQAAQ